MCGLGWRRGGVAMICLYPYVPVSKNELRGLQLLLCGPSLLLGITGRALASVSLTGPPSGLRWEGALPLAATRGSWPALFDLRLHGKLLSCHTGLCICPAPLLTPATQGSALSLLPHSLAPTPTTAAQDWRCSALSSPSLSFLFCPWQSAGCPSVEGTCLSFLHVQPPAPGWAQPPLCQ